eukprot:Sspe_Gene.61416::Locus_34083_Transcript_1_2_Confidence_0.750_Length_1389::g.61416::m.61416/K12410/npdA; NAD-dependent deacetylase
MGLRTFVTGVEEVILPALHRRAAGKPREAGQRDLAVMVCGGRGALPASAGLPNFMSREGSWLIGDTPYHPASIASQTAFKRMWWEVWAWYAWRAACCLSATPSDMHNAIADLSGLLGSHLVVLYQATDGLLQRTGSFRPGQLIETKGNVCTLRCTHQDQPHPTATFPLPELESIKDWRAFRDPRRRRLTQEEVELLRCPLCMSRARPNELWPDEGHPEAVGPSITLAEIRKRCGLLLFFDASMDGAHLGGVEQSLLREMQLNDGYVVNVASNLSSRPPADPTNARGHTGIRVADLKLLEQGQLSLPSPELGVQPPDKEAARRELLELVDAAEAIVQRHSLTPPTFLRLSPAVGDSHVT